MIDIIDTYYDREEISNSNLKELAKYWMQQDRIIDLEAAFRFGILVDHMITLPHRVNYFKLLCANVQYSKAEFSLAEAMKAAFWRDEFCRLLASKSEMQRMSLKTDFKVEYEGLIFYLDGVRCLWDLFAKETLNMCGEIKSTACATQKQFESSIDYFDYDQAAAWYMDIADVDKYMLIGISKVAPHKIFKVPVRRGDDLYKRGKEKYREIAFKYFYLFGDLSKIVYMDEVKMEVAV